MPNEREELTPVERDALENDTGAGCGRKALRIIDAHASGVAALVAQLEAMQSQKTDLVHQLSALKVQLRDGDDADAAMRDRCQALVAQLEAARGQLKAIGDAYDDMPDFAHPDQWRDFGERVAELVFDQTTHPNPTHAAPDALAADRAALVAQLEAARRVTAPDYDPITAPVPDGDMNGPHGQLPCPCGDWSPSGPRRPGHPEGWCQLEPTRAALVAQVAELTRERDEARKSVHRANEVLVARDAEVTRLTDELAAAERTSAFECGVRDRRRAEAAEARVRELTEALAATEDCAGDWRARYLAQNDRAEAAEARVRELEADVRDAHRAHADAVNAANARLAAAERKAESWERGHDYAWELKVAAESRLAAADALLGQWQRAADPRSRDRVRAATTAYFAAQPATAPAREG